MDTSLNTILTTAGVYAVAVSFLYLYGYWSPFGLNFLEFIGPSDLLGPALFWFLGVLVSIAFGFAISNLLYPSSLLPPGGGADTKIGRFGRRFWRELLALYLVVIVLIAIFGVEPGKWFGVAALVALLFIPLEHLDYIKRRIPDPVVRPAVLSLLLFLGGLAFAQGRLDAYRAQQGYGALIVDLDKSGLWLPADQSHPVSYMGHLGDFFVLYESARSQVVILPSDKITTLVLMANPKRE